MQFDWILDDCIQLNCKIASIQVEGEKINFESEPDGREKWTIREKKWKNEKRKERQIYKLNVYLDDAGGEKNRKKIEPE